MTLSRTGCLLFGAVLAFGLWFRVYGLDLRPMHTDESVHADKFGTLLDEGFYAYDPDEYHGPTLNYLSLLSAALFGQTAYTQITEKTLRIVPAVIGTLLLLTPLLFFDGIGLRAAVFSTVFLALSPAFVFYSRYYIQEMLLVCFTAGFLGGLWRYLRSQRRRWILLAGLCAGLMHATKETCALTFAAAMLAMLLTLVLAGSPAKITLYNRNGLLGLLTAIVVSALFFSSFGKNPDGILDSVLTYTYWLNRAGEQSIHAHPWYWYFDLLTWNELTERITWNEDVIVVGAMVGLFFAFRRQTLLHRRPFTVFLALFTLILTVIYSIIPYKTPWCVLNFLYGMVLLAGLAVDQLLKCQIQRWHKRVLCVILIIFGIVSPLVQSVFLNTWYCAHPGNPWVYAHTSPDIFKIQNALRRTAAVHPDGKAMYIQVVAPGHDYWPLPWYLRDFTAVAYSDSVDVRTPNPAILLGPAAIEQQVLQKLYESPPPGRRELQVPLFDEPVQLRPGVEWRGYLPRTLWEKTENQNEPVTSQQESEPQKDQTVQIQSDRKEIKNLTKFSHQAMNAVFEIWIQHDDGSYAARAARAAFKEADRLEQELSRFIENGDVGRINQADSGQNVTVSPDTMACLAVACEVCELTGGAFDITVGPLVLLWRQGVPTSEDIAAILLSRTGPAFALNESELTVSVLRSNVGMDLGGVGKGYAIDRMAQTLQEWGIQRALIHGGASSVLAMEAPEEKTGWPVVLSNPCDPAQKLIRLEMARQVLSCSGLQRGHHIINPQTGQAVTDKKAVWLLTTASAAKADALTTAFMVMPVEAVARFADAFQQECIMIMPVGDAQAGPEPLRFGPWPEN
jgi:uncharacterized protein (TIGR03663 family)